MDPDQLYAQALEVDPGNPYANAYRAHWLLQTKREAAMSDVQASFTKALSSGRVKEHVRNIQLAAWRNLSSDGEAEYVATVADMRKRGEVIHPQTKSDLWGIYSFVCGLRDDRQRLAQFSASVPVAEQLSMFQSLFFGADKRQPDENPRPGADACLAVLFEAAGQSEKAFAVWTELAERFPPRSGNRIGDRAREAINRLRRLQK
jgi:hypothetical protein